MHTLTAKQRFKMIANINTLAAAHAFDIGVCNSPQCTGFQAIISGTESTLIYEFQDGSILSQTNGIRQYTSEIKVKPVSADRHLFVAKGNAA